MYKLKLIFISMLLMSAYQVNAVVLTNSSTGSFLVEKTDKSGATSLLWGTPMDFFSTTKSSLAVSGISMIDIELGQAFNIANLTYYNADIIPVHTGEDPKPTPFVYKYGAVDLKINLNGPILGSHDFNMNLMVLETDNTGNAGETGNTGIASDDVDDIVSIALGSNDNSVISIGGIDYVFELLGFGNGESYNKSFSQAEESGSTVGIYAKLTAVPLPSAAILLVTAFSGLFISVNRRGKKPS